MNKITFVIHGKIKKKAKLNSSFENVLGSTHSIQFLETKGQGDATKLAVQAMREHTDYLISVGGDGMLNEVVNGYMSCDKGIRSKVILGVFPYGTGNDFAKTVNVTSDVNQFYNLINADKPKLIDIGKMNHVNVERKPAERYFINISDIGIGGYVSMRVNKSSKILGSNLSYIKAIVLSFLSYKHKRVRITTNSFEWEGPVLLVIMANGKFFGSGMCVAPEAQIDDGLMQLTILGNVSMIDYIKNLSKIKKGEKIKHPEVQYLQATTCKIETLEECTIDMDGEFIGYGPIETKMLKKEVLFLCG